MPVEDAGETLQEESVLHPVAYGFLQHHPPEMLSVSLLFDFEGIVSSSTDASRFHIAPTKGSFIEKNLQMQQGSQLV